LSILKYPLYIAFAIFVALVVYAMRTEKPRQFRVKLVPPSPVTEVVSEDSTPDQAEEVLSKNGKHELGKPGARNEEQAKAKKLDQPPSSVVVGYSSNDAGGKIVLTQNKCDRTAGLVAYTTAPDGKTDFGCWTNDELYIFIRWEKDGLNNYTFDRFIDNETHAKLQPKHLFDAAKESLQKTIVASNIQQTTASASGFKK